jgi:hypothetical protein
LFDVVGDVLDVLLQRSQENGFIRGLTSDLQENGVSIIRASLTEPINWAKPKNNCHFTGSV